MILADWITLGAGAGCLLLGALLGFGRGLKFFTSGIFGIIISVFLCYCFGGIILQLNFVQELLGKFAALWNTKDNFFCNFITKIHIEIVVYYIALFIVMQILRIITVKILKHVAESKNIVFKIINKTLGAALFLGMAALIALVVFQIIYWVGGSTAVDFSYKLSGSCLKLDLLFENNPLLGLVKQVQELL